MSNPPMPRQPFYAAITGATTVPAASTNRRRDATCKRYLPFASPLSLPASLCGWRIQHQAVVHLESGARHWDCSEQYRAPLSASEQYRAQPLSFNLTRKTDVTFARRDIQP